MQVTIEKRSLLRILGRTSGAVDKKATLAVLANVLLQTDGNTLRATGTDKYQVASDFAEGATVGTQGALSVNGKDLLERVDIMPDGPVHLAAANNTLVIKGEKGVRQFKVRYLDANEYPEIPSSDGEGLEFELDVAMFLEMIRRVRFAIATDETRPHINSALLECNGDRFTMVGTNGHSLAKFSIALKTKDKTAMLVPLKSLNELRRLLDEVKKDAAKCTLKRVGAWLFVTANTLSYGVKLIEAQFPPYDQVIPTKGLSATSTKRSEFTEAVKAAKLATTSDGGVKLSVNDKRVRIISQSPEQGEAVDEVAAESELKKEFTFGLASTQLLDLLTSFDEESVVMRTSSDAFGPVLFAPKAEDKKKPLDYIAIQMPLRL